MTVAAFHFAAGKKSLPNSIPLTDFKQKSIDEKLNQIFTILNMLGANCQKKKGRVKILSWAQGSALLTCIVAPPT